MEDMGSLNVARVVCCVFGGWGMGDDGGGAA